MSQTSIQRCNASEFESVLEIINDGARAYAGHVPNDRLHDPYMSRDELQHEISMGIEFWGYVEDGELVGVMGIQQISGLEDAPDLTLIRHGYVRRGEQKKGIGGQLLDHLRLLAVTPILIGTWADANWAIRFYERHGFQVVGFAEKERLLRTYWKIPDCQVETSVVLADERWRNRT